MLLKEVCAKITVTTEGIHFWNKKNRPHCSKRTVPIVPFLEQKEPSLLFRFWRGNRWYARSCMIRFF